MKASKNESRYIIQETADVNAAGDIVVNKKKIECSEEISEYYMHERWKEDDQWKRDHYHQPLQFMRTSEMSNRGVRKKVRLVSNRKSKPEIFEGVRAEEYKKLRNKWIRLAVVGTGLPFILGILISIFNDTFSILYLF